jgi:hypothetical protein
MGAHDLRRKEDGEAALDGLALYRVIAVRDPDTVRASKDLIVRPSASGGTALDLQMGALDEPGAGLFPILVSAIMAFASLQGYSSNFIEMTGFSPNAYVWMAMQLVTFIPSLGPARSNTEPNFERIS